MNKRISRYFTLQNLIYVVAVIFAVFHIYTSAFGLLTAVLQRTTHLTFAIVLLSLMHISGQKGNKTQFTKITAVPIIILAIFSCVYLFFNFKGLVFRAGIETTLDIVVAGIILLLVLEMTRRATGNVLPTIALIAIVYSLFGSYMPGALYHRGISLKRLLTYMSFGTEGILGTPLGTSATYVALFIIFGAFLNKSGTGDFFIRLANSLVGRFRGGPAKVAVMSSALMGTISGSAAANVAGTGSFTIPLMKKTGYTPVFAGAVEAAASTGGQLMPPIMGAAAFIMAEILGIPYVEIAKAAIIPAVLFFAAIFFCVDSEAVRLGLKGAEGDDVEKTSTVLKSGGLLIIPVVVLIVALFTMTPTRSALLSILACCIVGLLRNGENRMKPKDYFDALREGGEGILQIAVVCACAGIIAGTLTLTGLGIKLGYILAELAGGRLFPMLLLTAIASIILGMGVPTTASYIIMATVMAPSLIRIGVPPLPAHLFVFYYGLLSVVTPPVALAAYTAAGISGADAMKTGYAAWRLALPAFMIPFAFVYGNELLVMGDSFQIILACISGLTSVYALSGFVTGYFMGNIGRIGRFIMLAASICLIFAEPISDIFGYVIVISMIFIQKRKSNTTKTANVPI